MENKKITTAEMNEAMEEMRDSARKIMTSLTSIVKSIDWKVLAPKILMGLIVLYGVRNRKVLSSIVSSMVIGMVSDKVAEAMPAKA